MLIGIDASRAAYPERTGTENYSLHLIRHLLRIAPQHNFRLYFSFHPPPRLLAPGTNWEARVIPFPRLWTHLRLSWEVARHPPDVLLVPAHVLPLIHPTRCVVTVHDLGYLYYPSAHRPWDRLYLDLSTRFNSRSASQVIAISQATKEDLVKHYGTRPDKVMIIYPGVDASFVDAPSTARLGEVRKKYGLPQDYILHVGTIHPRKNLEMLLVAYRQLASDGHAPPLVIAGKKGWMAERLLGKIEAWNLGSRVHMPGYILAEDLPAVLAGARLFVFPSLYEGFGFPLLEAMAAGVPVIASNTSSIPEVAGEAALLVDPHYPEAWVVAMDQVLGDKNLQDNLVALGREQIKSFSWEKCTQETLAALERVVRS